MPEGLCRLGWWAEIRKPESLWVFDERQSRELGMPPGGRRQNLCGAWKNEFEEVRLKGMGASPKNDAPQNASPQIMPVNADAQASEKGRARPTHKMAAVQFGL